MTPKNEITTHIDEGNNTYTDRCKADADSLDRQRAIYRVTIKGSVINTLLLVFKFVAGIVGGSAAMIADAVHSLSDFLTDIVVMVFVRLSNKPEDKNHEYGHGKYETLATALIGIALLVVGVMICLNALQQIASCVKGQQLEQPGLIALVAAILSIVLKEWAFRFTRAVGQKVNSQAVVANAWHHRSDALSSIGTAIGIGGAIALGPHWAVLDPVAAAAVSFFIMRTAYTLLREAIGELLEKSLPESAEADIKRLAEEEPMVSETHHLRTRRIGNYISIDMHVRMPGNISLYEAHTHATAIEHRLRQHFGPNTYVNLHVEPLKVDGQYVPTTPTPQ